MTLLFWGALAMGSFTAGLFFMHFWKLTRDRLFLFFHLGFWAFAAHWLGLAITNPDSEHRYYLYLLRLLAFALFMVGVIDKNRKKSCDSD
jgi:hypothetical protein